MRALSLRSTTFVLGLFVTACGHGVDHKAARPPAAPAATTPEQQSAAKQAAGLREQQSWIDALPSCRAEDVAAASGAAERSTAPEDPIHVRGHLTTTAKKCTMMACRQCQRVAGADGAHARLVCGADLECCNQCGWDWAVEPVTAAPSRALRLQRAGEASPAQGAGLDCVLKHLPAPEVVVSGRLVDGDLVASADLCVVRAAK